MVRAVAQQERAQHRPLALEVAAEELTEGRATASMLEPVEALQQEHPR